MDIKKLTKIDDGFNKFEESYPINLIKYAYKKFGVSIKPLGASLYSIKSVKTKNEIKKIPVKRYCQSYLDIELLNGIFGFILKKIFLHRRKDP